MRRRARLRSDRAPGPLGRGLRAVAREAVALLPAGAVALALAATPEAGVAQAAPASAPVDVDVAVGFSGTFRPGRWTPVTVTVTNRGDPLAGRIELETVEGDEFRGHPYRVRHARTLELGRGSRKRFRFTVLPERLARPLVVRIHSAGREVARHTVDLREGFTAERLLLVLSRDADLDYLNDRDGRGLRVLYPHPELLPDRWQGYDAVAAVVVHGTSLERLSARQHEALQRWLEQGGTLAVSGGPDYALLRTPRLAALLPALPTGLVEIADVAAAGDALGGRLDERAPLRVHRVDGVRGRVLRQAGGQALVVEGGSGRGRVLYLTFDVARPPFDRWPAMRRLWLDGLGLGAAQEAPPPAPDTASTSAVPALLASAPSGFPGHGTLLLFLLLYLGVLAAGYLLRPGWRAGRVLAAASTWAAPVLFAPAALLVFGQMLFDGGPAAVAVSVVEPFPESAYARLRVDLGLWSTRREAIRFGYDGAEPAFRALAPSVGATPGTDWILNEDARRWVEPVDRGRYALHLLQGVDVVPFRLRASLERVGTGLRLRVRNDAGRALDEVWLMFDGAAYRIGPIAADQRIDRILDRESDGLSVEDGSWWQLLDRRAALAEAAVQATRKVLDRRDEEGRARRAGDALLAGYSRGPLRIAGGEAGAGWRFGELTLVLLELPAGGGTRTGAPTQRAIPEGSDDEPS